MTSQLAYNVTWKKLLNSFVCVTNAASVCIRIFCVVFGKLFVSDFLIITGSEKYFFAVFYTLQLSHFMKMLFCANI